jgi:hypothetical protein
MCILIDYLPELAAAKLLGVEVGVCVCHWQLLSGVGGYVSLFVVVSSSS